MSRLSTLLAAPGATVVTAELPTVDGGGLRLVHEMLDRLEPYVDAVNATDNAAAHAHASNVAIAIAIADYGLEPVLQISCRDKNRLALEADIVGAALHGVENVCCMTGDDVTAGDEPEARRVFDVDGPQAIRVAAAIAGGRYLSGRPITPAPALFLGAVENAAAPPLDYRVARAQTKADAGARFLQLQICYHPDRLEAFTAGAARSGLPRKAALLPTICLVRGARALRFMHEKVAGIDVPADTISRIESAPDQREAAYRLALEQAQHALTLPGVRGIHLTDFRHDDSVGRLVSDLGLVPSRSRSSTTTTKETHGHGSAVAV